MTERRAGGVVAADPVRAGARRRGGGADVQTRGPGAVGIEPDPGPEEDLAGTVGAGDDVAAHVVRVVGLEIGRPAHAARDDPVAKARRKPLDLPDHRLARVAWVPTR